MADRSQVTKITLAYLKDPKNMPKDNTPKPEELETDLEDLELPEEDENADFVPGSDEMLKNRPGGNPGRNPRSKNDLFNKKKKEVY